MNNQDLVKNYNEYFNKHNVNPKFIVLNLNNKSNPYRVRIRRSNIDYSQNFSTLELAITERNKEVYAAYFMGIFDREEVDSITNNKPVEIEQEKENFYTLAKKQITRQLQSTRFNNNNIKTINIDVKAEAFILCLMADIHIGNNYTNLQALKKDTEKIITSQYAKVGFVGDLVDNFIVGRLIEIQKEQSIRQSEELKLAKAWMELIEPKLIFSVSGNHDLWTKSVSGIDLIKDYCLPNNHTLLVDDAELVLNIEHNNNELVWRLRHNWPGRSMYNPTHAIEKSTKFFDVGVKAHTHEGNMFREYYVNNQKRYAISLGTYKEYDKYAHSLNFNQSPTHGLMVLVVYDNQLIPFPSIDLAERFIEAL